MLIDLKLDGKTIMVIGGGAEAYRKTQSFHRFRRKDLVD
jgi:siroheme synthase (precorrin-2 oxidase/ferrochelatase)